MKSMTGFGFGEYQDESQQLALELKCYNNRYLDIGVNIPSSLGLLEPRIRSLLSNHIRRGKVELSLKYRQLQENVAFTVDRDAVKSYAAILHQMAEAGDVDDSVNLSHLLKMEDLVKARRIIDPERIWSTLQPLMISVLVDFENTRVQEGQLTKQNIAENFVVIEAVIDIFKSSSAQLEESIKSTLRERFDQVMGNRIDEDRVLAETAVLLIKFSIEEEIVRLGGHMSAMRNIIEEQGPIGKKLDFLCQELNREINTVGSKSTVYALNSNVVDAKDAIEKIREQLRNVE